MRSAGIIKTQLTQMELDAQRIEAHVAKALQYMGKPSDKKDGYTVKESKIMFYLMRLDEIQEAIDGLMAELKEVGGITNYSYAGNVYEYKRPKPAPVVKVEKAPRKPRKEYPVKSPTPQKLRAKRAVQAGKKVREVKPRVHKPLREPKPVRVPKPKPVPVPRKPAASPELRYARKSLWEIQNKIDTIDEYLAGVKAKLVANIEKQEARLAELESVHWTENASQKRSVARGSIQNSQGQIDGLAERKALRLEALASRLEEAQATVERLTLG